MSRALARMLIALAAALLGEHRHDWAGAMAAEFDAADEDGLGLSFAFGCLAAACRDLPSHAQGRFALAAHALALVLIVPTAALLAAGLIADFPHSVFARTAAFGLLEAGTGREPLLTEANAAALPSLAALTLIIAAAHVRIAWLVLERDWTRVAATGALAAAASVTLILFSAVVFGAHGAALAHTAALAFELAGAAALARWQRRLSGAHPSAGG